jgi:hypothetical protein
MIATIEINDMTNDVLYVGNNNLMAVTDLFDEVANAFVNNATVTVDILDRTSTSILTAPITMPYVAASNGTYEGVIPSTTQLQVGRGYRAVFNVNSGAAQWMKPVVVQFREN